MILSTMPPPMPDETTTVVGYGTTISGWTRKAAKTKKRCTPTHAYRDFAIDYTLACAKLLEGAKQLAAALWGEDDCP